MSFSLTDPIAVDFVERVAKQASRVDKREEEDWHSLALGFALGRGLGVEEARAWANWASSSGIL